jgi:hypothetical protein
MGPKSNQCRSARRHHRLRPLDAMVGQKGQSHWPRTSGKGSMWYHEFTIKAKVSWKPRSKVCSHMLSCGLVIWWQSSVWVPRETGNLPQTVVPLSLLYPRHPNTVQVQSTQKMSTEWMPPSSIISFPGFITSPSFSSIFYFIPPVKKARLAGAEFKPQHLLAVWPWASHFPSVRVNLHQCS